MLAGLFVALLAVSSASAQEPTPTPASRPAADDVNRVAAQLYCPVCENEPLDVCQTPACVQWKAQIAQYLREGRSDDEIVQIFVDQFGLRVKADPLAETPILWMGPIVAAIVGAIVAVRIIRRMTWRGQAAESPPASSTSTGDEYEDRVERELKQQF